MQKKALIMQNHLAFNFFNNYFSLSILSILIACAIQYLIRSDQVFTCFVTDLWPVFVILPVFDSVTVVCAIVLRKLTGRSFSVFVDMNKEGRFFEWYLKILLEWDGWRI